MTGKLLLLPIADIEIGERIAVRDDAHITHLTTLFAADGQRDPIEVAARGPGAAHPWLLVAGYHRIHAAIAAGLTTIMTYQVADEKATVEQLKLIELSENVDHRKHRPIDLSVMIAARAEIEERIDYPDAVGEPSQIRASRVRWEAEENAEEMISSASESGVEDEAENASDTMSPASDWLARTADAFGMSLRTLHRYRAIHRNLAVAFPDHISTLNFHPALESFTSAYRLAKLSNEDTRRRVVEALIAHPEAETLDAAMVLAGVSTSKGSRASAADVPANKFQNGWETMRMADRRVWAIKFAGWVTPGVAREMVEVFQKRNFL